MLFSKTQHNYYAKTILLFEKPLFEKSLKRLWKDLFEEGNMEFKKNKLPISLKNLEIWANMNGK